MGSPCKRFSQYSAAAAASVGDDMDEPGPAAMVLGCDILHPPISSATTTRPRRPRIRSGIWGSHRKGTRCSREGAYLRRNMRRIRILPRLLLGVPVLLTAVPAGATYSVVATDQATQQVGGA